MRHSLWVLAGGLIVLVAVALIIRHRPAELEAVPEEIAVTEEESHEKETTTAAVVRATEPGTVAPAETTAAEAEIPSYTVEEMAAYVLEMGLNGDARKEALGDNYEAVQKWLDENYVPPVADPGYSEPVYYSGGDVLTPSAGVCYFDGHMETYYDLPMAGVLDIMYSLGYSGDYWVRSDGCKMFGDYIMCAADFGWLPRGSVVLTSLGWAIVCDTGSGGSKWIDIAVTW